MAATPADTFAKRQECATELDGLYVGRVKPPPGQTVQVAIALTVERLAGLDGKLQRLEPAGERLKLRSTAPPVRAPRRGHVGPRASRPRRRAVARSSSRGGDSGDSSDDPEPARRGDRAGETSRVYASLREEAVA